MLKRVMTLMIFAVALNGAAKEFNLVNNKKGECSIVVSPEAGVIEKRAAKDLADYLVKISGSSDKIEIKNEPLPGNFPIFLKIAKDKAIKGEGFRIKTDSKGVVISANKPLGVLYGAYDILKKYGGIRWLTPGSDGEYFKPRPTIKVPGEDRVENPDMEIRTFHMVCAAAAKDVFEWMARNNMRFENFNWGHPYKGVAAEFGAVPRDGMHAFHELLGGYMVRPGVENLRKLNTKLKEMHAENPELFALVDGKRTIAAQPCTTNPKTLEIMCENLELWIKRMPGDAYYIVGNDDHTIWCKCENCRKLDPKDEKELNFLSTRYWTFVNKLAGSALDKHPDADLWGWAYQNFQAPPTGVTPDKRIPVMHVYNRRCYRHKLDNPNCPVNKVFLDYYTAWSKLGNKNSTWEEIWPTTTCYLPLDHTIIPDIKTYKALGYRGVMLVIPPWNGTFAKEYLRNKDDWRAAWQAVYANAQLHWNTKLDIDKIYDEINPLFYGKAWEGGMKEFRALLEKASSGTPGCFGWGHGSSPGLVLNAPGIEEKLDALLEKALKSAQSDPDKRVLANVKKDKELFSRLKDARKHYLARFRELTSYKKSAPVKIDGIIDDPDWENAEVATNFKVMSKNTVASPQTFARIVHEPDNLYIAVEAMEPFPGKMVANAKDPTSELWSDSTIEVFLTHPDWAQRYMHYIFSPSGITQELHHNPALKAPKKDFKTGIEYKIKTLPDRWLVEMRIPTAKLGMKCFDGSVWKLNVGRGRLLSDGTRDYSSLNGSWHGADTFLPLSFARKRQTTKNAEVRDARIWKNASFNETTPPPGGNFGNWDLGEKRIVPKGYFSAAGKGKIALLPKSEGSKDLFMRIYGPNPGHIFQFHTGKGGKYLFSFEARGKGKIMLSVFRYTKLGGKHLGSESFYFNVDSSEWKNFSKSYIKKSPDETLGLGFRCIDGTIDIDNFYVSQQE